MPKHDFLSGALGKVGLLPDCTAALNCCRFRGHRVKPALQWPQTAWGQNGSALNIDGVKLETLDVIKYIRSGVIVGTIALCGWPFFHSMIKITSATLNYHEIYWPIIFLKWCFDRPTGAATSRYYIPACVLNNAA